MTIGERARQEQLERTATDPRRQFGWGVSPMASPEERAAFQAYEMLPKVAAGEIPVAALPESYGGRPTGTTRRAIRMQAEWDQSQQAALENQRLMQQMDLEQRRFTLSQRNQTLQEKQEARLQAAEAKAQDEAMKISEDADGAMNEVLGGGLDAAGNPIAGLDPDKDDYLQRRNDILSRYKKAAKDEAFKLTISNLDKEYYDRLDFQQQLDVQKSAADIAIEREGRMLERQLGAEERSREAMLDKEERARQKAKEEATQSQVFGIDKEIRRAREKLNETLGVKKVAIDPQTGVYDVTNLDQASQNLIKADERNIRMLEMDKAQLQGFMFNTIEEAQKAEAAGEIPRGTVIFVNGKRAVIE